MFLLSRRFDALKQTFDQDWTGLWEGAPLALKRVEAGYRLSLDNWEKLKIIFLSRQVIDPVEEIYFFQELKPHFCHRMEYCFLLNHALLFQPADRDEAIIFWTAEQEKAARFIAEREGWIKEQQTYSLSKLEPLFRYWYNKEPTPASEIIYMDQDCRSSHDHLIRSYLARQLYQTTIEQHLSQL